MSRSASSSSSAGRAYRSSPSDATLRRAAADSLLSLVVCARDLRVVPALSVGTAPDVHAMPVVPALPAAAAPPASDVHDRPAAYSVVVPPCLLYTSDAADE